MPELAGLRGHGESHFVVLPDHEAALAVAPRVQGPRTLTHASGRPWLTGRWRDDEITAAATRDARLAVIGCCPVTTAELERAAEDLRDLARLDELARRLPGSFHLVAALGGRCRVQGTASGLRLVFHTSVGGVTIAADRADLLADLTGAELDEQSLAVRLLFPVPHPLLERPLWRGIHCVPPGMSLTVDGNAVRTSRWWHPPEPTRSLASGAAEVREALTRAVEARTSAGGVVACDLSGGLDSTSVTFLAARGNAKVIASTWPGLDPADDDLDLRQGAARRAQRALLAAQPDRGVRRSAPVGRQRRCRRRRRSRGGVRHR